MALEMIDPLIREFERRNLFRHAESARRVKARLLRQQISNAAHDYQRWHLHACLCNLAYIGDIRRQLHRKRQRCGIPYGSSHFCSI